MGVILKNTESKFIKNKPINFTYYYIVVSV